jgi:uncharacterized membrane protein YfcA
LGIGVLVGMTGMGGGSLMTPLLILIFGIQPTTAIGTDIFYSAVTKTVGGWRHFRMKTVNMELVRWLATGSVPAAVAGVALVSWLQGQVGEDRLDELVYAVLGGTLLMVGIITLARALILRNLIDERDRFGVIIGAALSDRAPQGFIRTALGVVLVGSGIVTIQKGDPAVWPIAAGIAAVGLGLILFAPHWLNRRREGERLREAELEQERDQAGALGRTLPAD